MDSLREIKRLRKKYGLNQKELASKAEVSQSLIAKVEAGKIDPSFTKARQILDALEELREKEEIKAKDLMNNKLVFTNPTEKVKEVIKVMKKKGISQIPVLRRENVCGLITEGNILSFALENPEELDKLKVEDVMEEVPPIVSLKTGMKMLLEILRDFPVVLVAERGKVKGLISKSDLLGKV